MPGGTDQFAVRLCSATNITVSSPGSTVDGTTPNTGDRILLTGQTAPAENRIYQYNGSAVAMTPDPAANIVDGLTCKVSEGTSYGNSTWRLTTNAPIVVGTTALAWVNETNQADAAWKDVADGVARVQLNAAAGTTEYIGYSGGGVALAGANSAFGAFYLDPADFPGLGGAVAKVRLRTVCVGNNIAPGAITITAALKAATGSNGGTTASDVSIPSVAAAIVSAAITPAQQGRVRTDSSEAVAPAAGLYGLTVKASSALAANASQLVVVKLQWRRV